MIHDPTQKMANTDFNCMEFERPENLRSFMDNVTKHYPDQPVGEVLEEVIKWMENV